MRDAKEQKKRSANKEMGLNEWTARHTAVVAHHGDCSELSRALCNSNYAPLMQLHMASKAARFPVQTVAASPRILQLW
jgi:hypothetical protein